MSKFILGLLSLLLISGIANDFLSTAVENFGTGSTPLGQVWVNLTNYEQYIKEATFTVSRSTSQSYIDYPIEIISSFSSPDIAPLWEGMSPNGNIDFSGMKSIKIIKQVSDIWTEIPSQISYKTKCFDNLQNQIDCSEDHYRISLLRLFFLDNLTSSTQTYKILYPIGFGGSGFCDNCYVFNYNDTSGKYHYTAEYPTRMKYTHSTKIVNITEINEIISLTSDFDIENWEVGTGFPSCYDQINSRVMQCTGGTPKLFGITPTGNVDAPLMIETSVSNCNLMALGTGTGYFEADYFPVMTRLKVYTSVDSSIEGPPIVFTATRPGCGFGTTNDYGRSCIQYDNLTYSLFNFNCGNDVAESYNATPTAWGMVGGTTYELCGGYNPVSEYSENPFYFILKNTTSSFDHLIGVKGATSTHYAGGCAGSGYVTGKYVVDEIVSSDRWEVFVSPRTNPSYCTISNGYASFSAFNDIITSETFGGKIQKVVSSYSAPCTPTTENLCDQLGELTDSGLGERLGEDVTCNSDHDAVGYYDNCDAFHTCYPCEGSGCLDNGQSVACDDNCWGTWLNKSCITGSVYGENSCIPGNQLIQDCAGAGCISGQCGDTSKMSTVSFSVFSHNGNQNLNNVTVNITGSDYYNADYYTDCTTSSIGGDYCDVNLVAGNYRFTGSKDGYQTGAHLCFGSTGVTYSGDYATGCYATIPSNADVYIAFRLLNTTENANLTTLTVTTKFKNQVIPGVSINIVGTSLNTTALTDMNGRYIFEFEADNSTYVLTASKTGYITQEKNITLQVGSDNSEVIFLDQVTDITLFSNFGTEANRIFASGMFSNKLSVPLRFAKPGKVKISRSDVIVRPCKDVFCNEYDKLGLNIMYMLGGKLDLGVIFNVDANEFQQLPISTIKTIARQGSCGSFSTSETFDMVDSSNVTKQSPALFVTKDCTYNGVEYKLVFLYIKEMDPVLLGEFIDSLFSSSNSTVTFYLPSGRKITNIGIMTATEVLSSQGQDLMTDYVIFNVNKEALFNIMTDRNPTTVKVQGMEITGLPIDILVNPVYSPLIRTGTDPLILDSGILSFDTRKTNTAYDYDSKGLGANTGLESQNWKVDYVDVPVSTNFTFNILYSDLTKDVEWDLMNKIYESASVRYFDRDVGIVDRPIDNEKFKVETYIQAAFTPNDGSPTQYEYVKAISFVNTNKDKWMYYALIIGALILIFAPIILLLRGS